MNSNLKKKPDIIIVDDHLIFRQGLKAIINYEEIGTIIGEASNGEEFMELLTRSNPDLVLMDIDMPRMNGFEATKKALEIMPGLKIIAFTVFSGDEYSAKMKRIGAQGFILKSSGFNELENAIQTVMKGENYFMGNMQEINQHNPEENAVSISKRRGKMLFFPWVVNRKDYVFT